MKHLFLFEDYSDEEIEDLLGDLETIGHKYRLVPGEDFGFGVSRQPGSSYMGEKNDGLQMLLIKKEVVEDLVKRGIMERYKNNPGDVYFSDSARLPFRYPKYEFNQVFVDNPLTWESDYGLNVTHESRLDSVGRRNEYKDFAQQIFDYLSEIRI